MDLELDLELTPQDWPHFDTHVVLKSLDGSSHKKCIISTLAIYVSGIHMKKLKKRSSQQKMELTNNSE